MNEDRSNYKGGKNGRVCGKPASENRNYNDRKHYNSNSQKPYNKDKENKSNKDKPFKKNDYRKDKKNTFDNKQKEFKKDFTVDTKKIFKKYPKKITPNEKVEFFIPNSSEAVYIEIPVEFNIFGRLKEESLRTVNKLFSYNFDVFRANLPVDCFDHEDRADNHKFMDALSKYIRKGKLFMKSSEKIRNKRPVIYVRTYKFMKHYVVGFNVTKMFKEYVLYQFVHQKKCPTKFTFKPIISHNVPDDYPRFYKKGADKIISRLIDYDSYNIDQSSIYDFVPKLNKEYVFFWNDKKIIDKIFNKLEVHDHTTNPPEFKQGFTFKLKLMRMKNIPKNKSDIEKTDYTVSDTTEVGDSVMSEK